MTEKMKWSVEVEMEAPGADLDLADRIIEALRDRGPAVALHSDHVSIRFDSPGRNPQEAFLMAIDHLSKVLPGLESYRVVVERVSDLERDLLESNAPDLVGVAEVADLLGVTKQRASELADRETFPAPVARLAAGPVWYRSAVTHFKDNWPRRAGRPRRVAAAP